METKDPYLDAFTKLMRAHSSINTALSAEQALPKGMTVSQFGVLEALYHKGPLTHCEIAAKILKSRGNLTMVIDHLERDGLVERLPVAGDRRAVRVALTPEGEKTISTVFPRQAAAIRKVLRVLTQDELADLARLSRKLGLSLSGEKESSAPGGTE